MDPKTKRLMRIVEEKMAKLKTETEEMKTINEDSKIARKFRGMIVKKSCD